MLSVFPNLLNFGILVPVLFRVILGLYLIRQAYTTWKTCKTPTNKRMKSVCQAQIVLEFLLAVLILLGLFTQITAGLIALFFVFQAMSVKSNYGQQSAFELMVLLAVLSISLLFLGSGIFSIDLPL